MSSSYWQFLTQSWDVKKRVQECFGGGAYKGNTAIII